MLITSNISRLRRWPKPPAVLGLKNYCQNSEDADLKKKDKKEEETKRKMEAKQRMQDLLQSLSKGSFPTSEAVQLSRPKPAPPRRTKLEATRLDSHLEEAAKSVAKNLEGDPEQTESELLEAVQAITTRKNDLSNVLSSMEVKKELPDPELRKIDSTHPRSRLHDFKSAASRRKKTDYSGGLFEFAPLGIFSSDFKPSETGRESVLTIWDAAWSRELTITFTRPSKNYFEELIQWTEQGKLWRFPIDNEVGMEEEKSYSFADHIFLERHLKGWCPSRGPIKHFMELVCIGLSKNPYITVPRKIAHIEWFRDYFEGKKELLKDIGAI